MTQGNENKGMRGPGYSLGTNQNSVGYAPVTSGYGGQQEPQAPSYGGQQPPVSQKAWETESEARQREERAAAASKRVTHKKKQRKDPMKTKAEHYARYAAIERGDAQPKMEPRIFDGKVRGKPKEHAKSKPMALDSREFNPFQTTEEQRRRVQLGESAASRTTHGGGEDKKKKAQAAKEEHWKKYESLSASSSNRASDQSEQALPTSASDAQSDPADSAERRMIVQALTALFEQHPASYKMIKTILKNVVSAPPTAEGDKFRKLKLSNPKIKQSITDVEGALPLLLMFGWEHNDVPDKEGKMDSFIFYPDPNALRVPNMVLDGMAQFEAQYSASGQSSSSSSSSSSDSLGVAERYSNSVDPLDF
eukprot:g37338.t1